MTNEHTGGEWREEEISLGDLAGTLRRRKGTIAWSTFVCLGLAAGVGMATNFFLQRASFTMGRAGFTPNRRNPL